MKDSLREYERKGKVTSRLRKSGKSRNQRKAPVIISADYSIEEANTQKVPGRH